MRILSLLQILTIVYANDCHQLGFSNYMKRYHKSYSGEELLHKFENFKNNIKLIKNDKTLGINKYMDYSQEDFKNEIKNGCLLMKSHKKCKTFKNKTDSVPDSVDWRDQNAVTDVKNQGKCGSCWSFSSTGALEGAWSVKNQELVELSEQQLMDCSLSYGNMACKGGLMDNAFEYAIDKGMCSELEDPYDATLENCGSCAPVATFSECYDIPSGNQKLLKEAVAQQPVSVAIEADTSVFQLYKGGIISSKSCGTNLDHGVLIVGYGSEDGELYWIVKNSWGEDWGEDGYLRIKRSESENDVGICGIASQASFPVAI